MEPIIKFDNVSFQYEDGEIPSAALNGVSLEIEEGTFTAVLGKNGSGKSTLAKHLNAILVPTSGKVSVCGYDTSDENNLVDIRRRVGMVFQNPDNQIVASVVEDDVAFAPENLGIPSEEIRARVDEALKLVDMYEYRHHSSHLLSGGQKQRVAIAGVIAMRPRCIVLDEPTAMLDPSGRREVIDTIKRLNKENGMTAVLITHHMEEAAQADRIIIMDDGKVQCDGSPEVIFSHADEIRDLGLTVPETISLLNALKAEGLNVDTCALSAEDCAKTICAALKNTTNKE